VAPEVSVLMPVHNGARFVVEALESILRQTFGNFEFIIVDDGSTDTTPSILRDYAERDRRIVSLRNPENIGIARTLNRGLQVARGKFVARQDADDISLPERLRSQLDVFVNNPRLGFLGSAVQAMDEKGGRGDTIPVPASNTLIRWQMLFRNVFKHSTIMLRRSLLEENGLRYNEDFLFAQDYELWSRMLCAGEGANIAEPLVLFRQHGGQISESHRELQDEYANRVSMANMNRLGMAIGEHQVRTLREWLVDLPNNLPPERLGLCRMYFTLLDAFLEHTPAADKTDIQAIRAVLVRHILASVSLSGFLDLFRTGLFGLLFRNHPGTIFREPFLRFHQILFPAKKKGWTDA